MRPSESALVAQAQILARVAGLQRGIGDPIGILTGNTLRLLHLVLVRFVFAPYITSLQTAVLYNNEQKKIC